MKKGMSNLLVLLLVIQAAIIIFLTYWGTNWLFLGGYLFTVFFYGSAILFIIPFLLINKHIKKKKNSFRN